MTIIFEKTEEQIAKDKAAVEAMKNAKSNMDAALSRISTLEYELGVARGEMTKFKSFVPKDGYVYGGQKSMHDVMDAAIARATKALGDRS